MTTGSAASQGAGVDGLSNSTPLRPRKSRSRLGHLPTLPSLHTARHCGGSWAVGKTIRNLISSLATPATIHALVMGGAGNDLPYCLVTNLVGQDPLEASYAAKTFLCA